MEVLIVASRGAAESETGVMISAGVGAESEVQSSSGDWGMLIKSAVVCISRVICVSVLFWGMFTESKTEVVESEGVGSESRDVE